MMKNPKPPKALSAEAKRLWRQVYDASEMDPAALVLLDQLAECFDRLREAQADIRKHGIVLEEKTDRGTVKRKTNPACAVERDARAGLMRAWRLLGYDQQPPGGV